jgi:CMP-N-acetylneuraminic acid synthetase
MEDLKFLSVIPARGGSKGIPRKNVQLIQGVPLIGRMVSIAKRVKIIQRIVVSTDDAEIAAVAANFGAEIVRRPGELSGDDSPSEEALFHTLEFLRTSEGYEPDVLVFLQCTSPFTIPEDIEGTIDVMLREKADTALAVAPFHYFLWKHGKDGNVVGINHCINTRLMRQQNNATFIETGGVYVVKVSGFRKFRNRFFGKTVMHVIPSERCFEIDDPWDLLVAKAILSIDKTQQAH